MKIDNEFTVSVPIERAWEVLTDLEGIAPCMPGAQLTGMEGDAYLGKVKIKVGPVVAEYAGTATFSEKDDAGYRAVIDARGRDSRGAGNATALITAQLRPDGDHTRVTVETDLKISGKIAQFGSGMIKEVSQKLLGQFVDCLEAKVVAPAIAPIDAPTDAPVDATAEPTGEAPAGAAPVAAESTGEAPAGAARVAADSVGTDSVGTDSLGPDAIGTDTRPANPPRRVITPTAEPEAIDLMSVAGRSVIKRAVPAAVAAVVAVIIYFIVR